MTRDALLRLLRAVFSVLTLVAVARQLVIHVQLGYSVCNFFSYFTNLSNVLAACVFLLGAQASAKAATTPFFDGLRLLAATNMAVVGIVFSVLLRDADLGSLLPWVNVVVHYLMPCVVILDWVAAPPRTAPEPKQFFATLVFPVVYLAYVLVRGRMTAWYPYPFFNPVHVGGYGGVALYAAGVAAVFLAGGWGLIALAALRRSRT